MRSAEQNSNSLDLKANYAQKMSKESSLEITMLNENKIRFLKEEIRIFD